MTRDPRTDPRSDPNSDRATAEKIVAEWANMTVDRAQYRYSILIDAIAASLAAEREQCAKVADGYLGADVIAAAIRARQ